MIITKLGNKFLSTKNNCNMAKEKLDGQGSSFIDPCSGPATGAYEGSGLDAGKASCPARTCSWWLGAIWNV